MAEPSDLAALVGSRSVLLSTHAVERYQERVKPALELPAALVDLRRVLSSGEVQRHAPAWVSWRSRADEWIVLADAIAFPVSSGRVVTCLTRAAVGDDLRVVRAERRQRTDSDGFRRKVRKPHGKVARDELRRRRDLLID